MTPEEYRQKYYYEGMSPETKENIENGFRTFLNGIDGTVYNNTLHNITATYFGAKALPEITYNMANVQKQANIDKAMEAYKNMSAKGGDVFGKRIVPELSMMEKASAAAIPMNAYFHGVMPMFYAQMGKMAYDTAVDQAKVDPYGAVYSQPESDDVFMPQPDSTEFYMKEPNGKSSEYIDELYETAKSLGKFDFSNRLTNALLKRIIK